MMLIDLVHVQRSVVVEETLPLPSLTAAYLQYLLHHLDDVEILEFRIDSWVDDADVAGVVEAAAASEGAYLPHALAHQLFRGAANVSRSYHHCYPYVPELILVNLASLRVPGGDLD